MKNHFLKIFVVVIFLSGYTFSQNLPNGTLYYEGMSEQFCSEHLKTILDGFFVNLQNNPDAKGFAVFHGKEGIEGQVLTLQKNLRLYAENRKFDSSRFEIFRNDLIEKQKIPANRIRFFFAKVKTDSENYELWLLP